MSGRVGSITTDIVSNGLVFNIDAANRASTIPNTSTIITFNTVDSSVSGSISTDATWEDGSPSSFDFDGTDGYIDFSNLGSIWNMTNSAYTINLWYKQQQGSGGGMPIIHFYGGSGGTTPMFWIYNRPQFSRWDVYNNNGAGLNRFVIVTTTGVWYNITFTWSASEGLINAYQNGVFNSSQTQTSAPASDNTNFEIGRDNALSTNLNANIASLQLYNRALSAAEVLQNYNALKGRFGV